VGTGGRGFDRESELRISEHARALIAGFVTGRRQQVLPSAARDAARLCLLDALGATLVGTLTPVAEIAAEYALKTWPGDQASVIAAGHRALAVGAAFANGTAANATDVDDCAMYTWGHPGAQIMPTAIALCEQTRQSGQALLEALVVGYEIAFRAARCSHDYHDLYRACGSWGSVACAAVAARLMHLNAEHTLQALGIADYNSPYLPMMRDVDHPTMVKHGIGLGAATGVMSAQLAQLGFTGTPALITAERYEEWVGDLGDHYLIDGGVTFKTHSCCAWTHPALLAVSELRSEHEIPPERVTRIEVKTYEQACRLDVRLPETTEQAQFSLPWTIAVMLVDGEVGPSQVMERRLKDERVRRLASSVDARCQPELTSLHALSEDFDPQGMDAAAVRIELDDGTMFDSGLVDLPVRRLSPKEVELKFRRLASAVLTDAQIDRVVDFVFGLEDQPSIVPLMEELLATRQVAESACEEGARTWR
jgi:2-methylcitrate dehydratase PrpD